MKKQETVQPRKRGPKPTGKGTPVQVRLQPDLLISLDRYIQHRKSDLSRPEAIRLILQDALTSKSGP